MPRDPLSARRLVGPWWSKLVGNDSADGLPRAPSFRGSRLIPTSSKCELLLPKGLSITTRHRLWAVLIAFLVLVALGCRGTLGVDESTIVHPYTDGDASPHANPTTSSHGLRCHCIVQDVPQRQRARLVHRQLLDWAKPFRFPITNCPGSVRESWRFTGWTRRSAGQAWSALRSYMTTTWRTSLTFFAAFARPTSIHRPCHFLHRPSNVLAARK